MSHLNYNHLYYFWLVCKEGSITKAADALFLTPQTVTGQIKTLEGRMKGKLTKRNGRTVEPTELGQLVFKYADRMFGLSYEMLDIVNYSQHSNILFEVGVADALSKKLVSQILSSAVPEDLSIHLICYESTHELLLERLALHNLDMILSDYPVDSAQSPGLFSKKLGESRMAFFMYGDLDVSQLAFSEVVEQTKLLLPGRRTAMGRKALQWLDLQGITPNVLGEFDDVALLKAFATSHENVLFLAPLEYQKEESESNRLQLVFNADELKEEYYVIFAERMIQHPAVKNICDADFAALFA